MSTITTLSQLKDVINELLGENLEESTEESSSLELEIAAAQERLNSLKERLTAAQKGGKRKKAIRTIRKFLDTELKGDDVPIQCRSKNHPNCTRETIEEMADTTDPFETLYYQNEPNAADYETLKNGFYLPVTSTTWYVPS